MAFYNRFRLDKRRGLNFRKAMMFRIGAIVTAVFMFVGCKSDISPSRTPPLPQTTPSTPAPGEPARGAVASPAS
jgi:hypothetical protein